MSGNNPSNMSNLSNGDKNNSQNLSKKPSIRRKRGSSLTKHGNKLACASSLRGIRVSFLNMFVFRNMQENERESVRWLEKGVERNDHVCLEALVRMGKAQSNTQVARVRTLQLNLDRLLRPPERRRVKEAESKHEWKDMVKYYQYLHTKTDNPLVAIKVLVDPDEEPEEDLITAD
eukprot:gene21143-1173_t